MYFLPQRTYASREMIKWAEVGKAANTLPAYWVMLIGKMPSATTATTELGCVVRSKNVPIIWLVPLLRPTRV